MRLEMDQLLLKVEDAAKLLGIGRSKTYDLIQRGILPHVRLGGSVRVPLDALREWVRDQTQAPRA